MSNLEFRVENLGARGLNSAAALTQVPDTFVGIWNLGNTGSDAPENVDFLPYKNKSCGGGIGNNDGRQRVADTDITPGGKYRSIVKLFLRYTNQKASDPWVMATGWLAAPDLVVTAGQSAYDWSYKMGHLTQVKAYIGYSGKASIRDPNVQFRQGSLVATTAEWLRSKGVRAYDIAFIKLQQPFSRVTPIKFEDTPKSGLTSLGVVGYAGDLADKYTGEKGAHMYEVFSDINWNLEDSEYAMLEYALDPYGGSSGSPTLRRDDLVSIGTHVYGGYPGSASVIGLLGNSYQNYIAAFSVEPAAYRKSGLQTGTTITYVRVSALMRKQEVPQQNQGLSSQNALSQNALSENALSENALSQNALSQNALSQNALSQNSLSQNSLSQNAFSQNALSQNALSQNSLGQNSLGQNSLSQNSLGQNGLGQNSLGQNGLGQNGLGQNGLGQNSLGQNGLGQNGLGQNDLGQNDLGQNGLGQSGSGFSRSGFSQNGFSQNGFSQNGFSQNGFSQNGLSQTGLTQSRFAQKVSQAPPLAQDDEFFEILKIGIKLSDPTLGNILEVHSPIVLGSVGSALGALAGAVLVTAGKFASFSSSLVHDFHQGLPYDGVVERAILGEAAFCVVMSTKRRFLEEEGVFANMAAVVKQISPATKRIAPCIMDILTAPALRIALDALHNKTGGSTVRYSAASSGGSPFAQSYTPSNTTLDAEAETFVKRLSAHSVDHDDSEGSSNSIDRIIQIGFREAGPVLTSVASQGLQSLANSLPEFAVLGGNGAPSHNSYIDGLPERAMLGEAALQALMKLPENRLDEGKFDIMAKSIARIGKVVLRSAHGLIEDVGFLTKALVTVPVPTSWEGASEFQNRHDRRDKGISFVNLEREVLDYYRGLETKPLPQDL